MKAEAYRKAIMDRHHGLALIPMKDLICHSKSSGPIASRNLGPFIGNQAMSFVRIGSRFHVLHLPQDGNFKSGGVTYEQLRDGSVRAHNKPRSRVKRLREERVSSGV